MEPEYGRLYDFLRGIGSLRTLVQKVRNIIGRYRRPAWSLQGNERSSGKPVTVFYIGQLENKNYFVDLVFDENVTETGYGNAWLWSANRLGRKARADLLVIHMYRSYYRFISRGKGFFIPCWIGMEVDLVQARQYLSSSKSIKGDLRRIKKNKLEYDITTDPDQFRWFYNNMYLPYIENTHGNRAMTMPWEELQSELNISELMLIKRNDKYIVGSVMQDMGKGRVHARCIGVLNGDWEHVRAGAMAASYCFEIEYLFKKGYRKIHYGAARAFMHDGVLRYKKKFGAKIIDTDGWGFNIRPVRFSEGVRAFFMSNPFLTEDCNRFYGNIFLESMMKGSDDEELRKEITKEVMNGVTANRVYMFNLESSEITLQREYAAFDSNDLK